MLALNQKNKTPQTVDMSSDTIQDLAVFTDTQSTIRLGLFVLVFGFGAFLLWAAFAPLDEGVPTDGSVSIETKRKVVQHFSGGIVSEIKVKEGQLVEAGDVLLTLDTANTKAKFEEIRQQYLGLRAQESRLIAEKAGQSVISFHPDLLAVADDPYVQANMQNQTQLLHARQASLNADLNASEEAIKGQEAQVRGYQGLLESRRQQLTILNDQLKGMRELVKDGFAPKNQQSDLEQRVAQLNGDIADAEANIVKSQRSIGELRQRAITRRQENQKEIDTQMAQVRLEVGADADKFHAITKELSRTDVRAPVSGQVVGLQFQTVGAVVQPGQKLMDIVPLTEGLLLEVKVPPHMIDHIRAGLDADIRFSSFANSPQLVVEGKVDSVSKDLVSDPTQTQTPPYYLARISVTPAGMKVLGKRQMQAGMPVQVMIKTGERSFLTYLMHPMMKRLAASLKEE